MKIILILIFLGFNQSLGSNILFLNNVLSPSHHMWNKVLANTLASRGHNVTFVSVMKETKKIENLHEIAIENVFETFFEDDYNFVSESVKQKESKLISASTMLLDFVIQGCKAVLKGKNGLEKILSYPDDFKFDLVLFDFTAGSCLFPLIHKFKNPPVVGVTAFLIPPYTTYYVGGHKYPAYSPYYTVDFPQVMNFYQRFYNHLLYWIEKFSFEFYLYPELEKITRERFKFEDMPPLKELEQKTKLLLLNADNAIDYPEPLQPNMILVGGLQIKDPKELPKEMKEFVEGGKKGTILMSLGTNILSSLLGEEILTSILKTFESLPDYNFVWKFEAEPHELPVKPAKNVLVSKFLPQNDILAHKNLKAFITHAGGLSTQESLWYGKPMIGIPFIADQYRNIDKSVRMSVAIKMEIASLKVDNFRSSILEVLENEKYFENARKVSKLFQDKPMKPIDTAIYWIEYVMRNPDAPFFKSPTLELGFLASNSLDIYLFIIISIHLIAFTIVKLLRKIFRRSKSNRKIKVN